MRRDLPIDVRPKKTVCPRIPLSILGDGTRAMRPELRIVDRCYQEHYGCLTMTDIVCGNGKSIDLLGVQHPPGDARFHVECLFGKDEAPLRLSTDDAKDGKPYLESLDTVVKERFDHPDVKAKIVEILGASRYNRHLIVDSVDTGHVRNGSVQQTARDQFGASHAAWAYRINLVYINDCIDRLKETAQRFGVGSETSSLSRLMAEYESREGTDRRRLYRNYIVGIR